MPVASPTVTSKRSGGSASRAGSSGANGFHGLTFSPLTVITRPVPTSPSRKRWKTVPRWSAVFFASASSRRRAQPPSGLRSGRTRSSLRHSTTVPPGPATVARARARCSSLSGSATTQSSISAISSRSIIRDTVRAVAALLRLTTVSDRHCDSDAVFSPSPYRPRSPRP